MAKNSQNGFFELIIKGVPRRFSNDHVLGRIRSRYPQYYSARRIVKFEGPVTSFVRIRTHEKHAHEEILKSGLFISRDFNFKAELPDKKPRILVRCFHCQDIGDHVANDCTNDVVCQKCAGPHEHSKCNSQTVKCRNCKSETHSASDEKCPVWRKKLAAKRSKTNATQQDVYQLEYRIYHQSKYISQLENKLDNVTETLSKKHDSVIQQMKSDYIQSAKHLENKFKSLADKMKK